jgi:hypothetical protein
VGLLYLLLWKGDYVSLSLNCVIIIANFSFIRRFSLSSQEVCNSSGFVQGTVPIV